MLADLHQLIASSLFEEASSEDLFNPYSTINADLDLSNACDIRQNNLKHYICDRDTSPGVLLLAEAPGPWGCRFSGVPITSEQQLLDPDFPLSGQQSSKEASPHKEYSASIYWRILVPFYKHIFTWNTVPFHPHFIEKPLTIRTPRMSEIKRFLPLVAGIINAMQPKAVIAVGRKAEKALTLLEVESIYVRHPSQGGAILFEQGVREVMASLNLDASHE